MMWTVMLLVLAAFSAGAAAGVWWCSAEPDHRDVDKLARRDRLRWSDNADERWYEQNDGWVQ